MMLRRIVRCVSGGESADDTKIICCNDNTVLVLDSYY